MNATVLRTNEYPILEKIKKRYNINRVLDIKAKKHLEVLELITNHGIFRAYGKNTKDALKNCKKVLERDYK
jgi:hypothetical protein